MWLHPLPCRPCLVPISHSWGVWPTQDWLADLLRAIEHTKEAGGQLHFRFDYWKMDHGQHDMLKRHTATCTSSSLHVRPLRATATLSMCTREAWEIECLVLAALAAVMARTQIRISGLHFELPNLKEKYVKGQFSNPHLKPTCMLALDYVESVPSDAINPFPLSDEERRLAHQRLQLPGEVVRLWDDVHGISKKTKRFCSGLGDYFPEAAALGRFRGDVNRGGLFLVGSCLKQPLAFDVFPLLVERVGGGFRWGDVSLLFSLFICYALLCDVSYGCCIALPPL